MTTYTSLKQFYLVFILLIFSCSAIPKNESETINKQEVDKLISSLSWNSIQIITNYGTSLKIIDPNAIKLEKMGKTISGDLLKAFNDDNKSFIIHLILTNIWEPDVNYLKIISHELIEPDDIMLEYRINNLSCYQSYTDNNSPEFSMDTVERDKVYKYWRQRISECSNSE